MSNQLDSKLNVKYYYESSKVGQFIYVIFNDTLDKLHTNLKTIAKSILHIMNNINIKMDNLIIIFRLESIVF